MRCRDCDGGVSRCGWWWWREQCCGGCLLLHALCGKEGLALLVAQLKHNLDADVDLFTP